MKIGIIETRRKVSALSYAAIRQLIEARAYDKGVQVDIVNLAYSSAQGQLLAVKSGLTVHGGAAIVLARRGHGYGEHLPKVSSECSLQARGRVIRWKTPARMSAGGTTAAWRAIGADIRQVLAAQYRGRSHGPQRHSRALSVAVVGGGIPPLSGDFVVDF